MRAERRDDQMYPLGHALSMLIPGWNLWQAWRHFRTIDALLATITPRVRVDAASAAIGSAIWWLTFTHYSSDPPFLLLDAIELAAGTAVVVYGQRALNVHWTARGAEERLLDRDLVALGLAAAYTLTTVVFFLLSPGA